MSLSSTDVDMTKVKQNKVVNPLIPEGMGFTLFIFN